MAWTNFSVIAFGSLLMSVPILLHLLMKQRPRKQVFPALRFLRQRQIANKRQMRLRNWLLLALRIAAIGLLAAVFARPSVSSVAMADWLKTLLLGVLTPLAIAAFAWSWIGRKGNLMTGSTGLVSLLLIAALAWFGWRSLTSDSQSGFGDAQAPVAAVIVVDTSPRMGLRHANNTRLEEAREAARELIKQLPPESEVAIVDAASRGTFSVDLGTAVNMLDSLRVAGFEYPLSELVLRGIDLVRDRDDKRKEVYVMTDLSEVAWREGAFASVRSRLADQPDISLFVLDVGVEQPRNVQLGQLRLSSDSLAKGQPLEIEADISSLHFDGSVDVEVLMEEPDPTRPVIVDGDLLLPEPKLRDRVTQTISDGGRATVRFSIRSLPEGVHHGMVQLKSEDGLDVDNVRYFTVEVRPPYPVLLASGPGANPQYVKQAISPDEFERKGQSRFDCHLIDVDDLASRELTDFSVIALLDPKSGTQPARAKLEAFVRAGGGLVIFLGRNAQPTAAFNEFAGPLLPGPLMSHYLPPKGSFFLIAPRNNAHPIMRLFRGEVIAWDDAPIYRHWKLDGLSEGTNVVTVYSNDQPAICETALGSGRIVIVTTPFTDDWNDAGRPAWNRLSATLPSFMLLNGIFPYLADRSGQAWNHGVGQLVTVASDELDAGDAANGGSTWQLVTPLGDWQNIRSDQGKLTVAAADVPGVWRLKPMVPDEPAIGFSVNLPEVATDLARLDTERLDDILSKDRFLLARGTEQLSRGIGQARVGRELFPFLMLIVVGLLAMEHLLSNRFYAPSSPAGAGQRDMQTAA